MIPKQIDWLAVEMVCGGQRMKLRFPEERRAVVRYFDSRMLNNGDNPVDLPPGIVTASYVASLICIDARSIVRIRNSLRAAVRRRCPQCAEPMWVCDDATVELHANRWNETCGYTYDVGAMAS